MTIETTLVALDDPVRADTSVRHDGRTDGDVVVLVHGNISSSIFWEETLLGLPSDYRGLAPDLRGFGDTQALPIDATRGVRDFADDLHACLAALGVTRAHLVGWSMGGGVVMQYLLDHPSQVASLTLVNPVSPYGYGGTREDGTPVSPDGLGTGGGTANPDFVQRLAAGDTSDDPASPRAVMNALYFAGSPRLDPGREDAFVASMLTTRTGEDFYPGDSRPSPAWPSVLPGGRGVLNTMAPTHFDTSAIVSVETKPPVLWVRGDSDQIVSDAAALDLAVLGAAGAIPDWPGHEVYPPQPMVTQTRAVLSEYAARGGSFREEVFAGVGHSPHVERPEDFRRVLVDFLSATRD